MAMSEQEALRRSRELLEKTEESVDLVSSLILRDHPDAGPAELGGMFDAHGAGSWNPQRDPKVDFSLWGHWECWEHCVYEGGRVVASGDWVAWDASTGVPGQQIGFGDKSIYTARQQAERMAVYQNAGRATRVVSVIGASASALAYQEVRAEIETRIDNDTRAAMRAEAQA